MNESNNPKEKIIVVGLGSHEEHVKEILTKHFMDSREALQENGILFIDGGSLDKLDEAIRDRLMFQYKAPPPLPPMEPYLIDYAPQDGRGNRRDRRKKERKRKK